MRNHFIDTLFPEFERRDDLFIITGDAGLGVLDHLKERYPDRFLNLGVAEQNAVSFSAGLAMAGFKVYLYNVIPFVLYRPYEQVRNDICYQNLPVVLVGVGSGITSAPAGMSHYSVEDLGIVQTLPGLTVISPADPLEAAAAARYSLQCNAPLYVRLAKKGEPIIDPQEVFDITEPRILRRGTEEIAILFHGSISREVVTASEALEKCRIYPTLVSVPFLQPLDEDFIYQKFKGYRFIVSVEEHFVSCGLGSMLQKISRQYKAPWELISLGIDYRFIHQIGDTDRLRERFGISSDQIVRKVKDLISTKSDS